MFFRKASPQTEGRRHADPGIKFSPEYCCDLGRCRCVRANARVMVCGALHAAVVVTIEVARRAIAPMSAQPHTTHSRRAPTGAYATPGCHVGCC